MRLVFLGSGRFAIPSLEALLAAGHEVLAVVTQPDKEQGRGRQLAPPPLKPVADLRGLLVMQPRRIREESAAAALAKLAPQVQVVVAYGQILPKAVIENAPRGTVNVHASLLPRYRGAAPVQWALVEGESETGVSTMLIDEGLDTGPVLLQRATPIGPEETAPELAGRLARLGAALLLETLSGLESGTLKPVPQDHSRATLARQLRREDGRIDWKLPAESIARRVRGFEPWPGTSCAFEGRALRVLRASAAEPGPGTPGEIVEVAAGGLLVACGAGSRILVREVQPESRRAMTAAAFAAGAHLRPGRRLE